MFDTNAVTCDCWDVNTTAGAGSTASPPRLLGAIVTGELNVILIAAAGKEASPRGSTSAMLTVMTLTCDQWNAMASN